MSVKTFLEFVRGKTDLTIDQVRQLVLDTIEADDSSHDVDVLPLAAFYLRKNVLTLPALRDNISNNPNRGFIINLVNNAHQDTQHFTVGALIRAIANQD